MKIKMGLRRPTVGYPSARSFEYEGPGFVCVRVAPLCFCNVAAVFSKLFGFRFNPVSLRSSEARTEYCSACDQSFSSLFFIIFVFFDFFGLFFWFFLGGFFFSLPPPSPFDFLQCSCSFYPLSVAPFVVAGDDALTPNLLEFSCDRVLSQYSKSRRKVSSVLRASPPGISLAVAKLFCAPLLFAFWHIFDCGWLPFGRCSIHVVVIAESPPL